MSNERIKINRYDLKRGSIQEMEDEVAVDEAVCIFINDEFYRTLIATPGMTKELVVGHLKSENIVKSLEDVQGIEIQPSKVLISLRGEIDLNVLSRSKVNLITTACGSVTTAPRGGQLESLKVHSSISVEAEIIWRIVRELNKRSALFRRTGGTHSAMLCSKEGSILAFAEDVGRHNAVDKVVGAGVLKGVDMGECVLVSSGRQSSEMVLKAARSGVPVIASVAGPLDSGITIAQVTGITLICFVRGRRMNVYTHPQRLNLTAKNGSL